jgi:hypothetical protein
MKAVESPGIIERAPEGLVGAARVAWYRRRYADYPEWLGLYIKGGVEFGGLTAEQPPLL